MNTILVIVLFAAAALVIFLIIRNNRDREDVEKYFNEVDKPIDEESELNDPSSH